MDLLLKILGGLCLGAMALLAVLYVVLVVLRGRLRKAMSEVVDQFKYSVVHPRLHLVREKVAAWKHAGAVEGYARPLREAGFQEAGVFRTREMDYLRVMGLAHSGECIQAAIYEHDAVGVFMDLVTSYQDGTSITYSTAAQGGELRPRPGHPCVREPGAGAADLLRRMLAERPARPMRRVPIEGWASNFEQSYAESMDWRMSLPFDPEEAKRVAERELTDEELEGLRDVHEANQHQALWPILYERFSRTTTMTGAEWDRAGDLLVFIHDRLSRKRLQELFDEWYNVRLKNEDHRVDPDWSGGDTPRAAFAAVNARLPKETRFRKAGEIDQPVPTDVYLAPEGPAFWGLEDDDADQEA